MQSVMLRVQRLSPLSEKKLMIGQKRLNAERKRIFQFSLADGQRQSGCQYPWMSTIGRESFTVRTPVPRRPTRCNLPVGSGERRFFRPSCCIRIGSAARALFVFLGREFIFLIPCWSDVVKHQSTIRQCLLMGENHGACDKDATALPIMQQREIGQC